MNKNTLSCLCKKDLNFNYSSEILTLNINGSSMHTIECRMLNYNQRPCLELFYSPAVYERNFARRLILFHAHYQPRELSHAIELNGDLRCSSCDGLVLTKEQIISLFHIYQYSNQFIIDSLLALRSFLDI